MQSRELKRDLDEFLGLSYTHDDKDEEAVESNQLDLRKISILVLADGNQDKNDGIKMA